MLLFGDYAGRRTLNRAGLYQFATPPHGRAIGVPRRASSVSAVNAQKLVPQVEAGPPFVVRAARSSVGARRAV